MKRVVSFLLIFALILSLAGCKRRPETSDLGYTDDRAGGDTAETDDKEPDYDDVEAVVLNPSESGGKNENELKSQPKQPNSEAENPALDVKPLRYTAKHEPEVYVSFTCGTEKPSYPMVRVINSKEQLEAFIPVFGCKDPSSHVILYHERTDSVPNNYDVPIKEGKTADLYDNSFFEDHVLVAVISKADHIWTAPEVSHVGADGTIEIDLHIPKDSDDLPEEYFCDYIELDKEYAGLDFKVKYNEISVDEYVETGAPLPEYPNSMDFTVKRFDFNGISEDCRKEQAGKSTHIYIISSVQELEEYFDYALNERYRIGKGDIVDCIQYSRDKRIDFTVCDPPGSIHVRKDAHLNIYDYYNEEFFKDKIICAIITAGSSCSQYQVRSAEPDGTIIFEHYYSNIVSTDVSFDCEFIELDKSCRDLSFKTEWNGLYQFHYRWNGKSK